jgi:hypothetical protein
MLTTYLTFAIVPLALALCYLLYKFTFKNKVDKYLEDKRVSKELETGVRYVEDALHEVSDEIDQVTERAVSGMEEAKEIVLGSMYDTADRLRLFMKWTLHEIMHYFVLFMRLLRDGSDWIYTHSRDRFMESATKERRTVTRFWKYLKEYKKESDQEE